MQRLLCGKERETPPPSITLVPRSTIMTAVTTKQRRCDEACGWTIVVMAILLTEIGGGQYGGVRGGVSAASLAVLANVNAANVISMTPTTAPDGSVLVVKTYVTPGQPVDPQTAGAALYRVHPSSGLVSWVAGNVSQWGRDDGPANAARFGVDPQKPNNAPFFYRFPVCFDNSSTLGIVIDAFAMRAVDLTSGVVATVAGNKGDTPGLWLADGLGCDAGFRFPFCCVAGAASTIYVAEWSFHIRKVQLAGLDAAMVTTLVGNGGYFHGPDGPALAVPMGMVSGMAYDRARDILFFKDYWEDGTSVIRIRTVAGDGQGNITTVATLPGTSTDLTYKSSSGPIVFLGGCVLASGIWCNIIEICMESNGGSNGSSSDMCSMKAGGSYCTVSRDGDCGAGPLSGYIPTAVIGMAVGPQCGGVLILNGYGSFARLRRMNISGTVFATQCANDAVAFPPPSPLIASPSSNSPYCVPPSGTPILSSLPRGCHLRRFDVDRRSPQRLLRRAISRRHFFRAVTGHRSVPGEYHGGNGSD